MSRKFDPLRIFMRKALMMSLILQYCAIAYSQPLDTLFEDVQKPVSPLVLDTTTLDLDTAKQEPVKIINPKKAQAVETPHRNVETFTEDADIVAAPQPEDVDSSTFSLFNYGKIVGICPSLSYFYYNEHIVLDDLMRSFKEKNLFDPTFVGSPKSSEYGFVPGFQYSVLRYIPQSHFMIRPKIGLFLGIGTTYDGTSQAMPLVSNGDTIGYEFDPHKDNKTNLFLFTSCDLGYVFSKIKWPTALYSGIDFKLWYRDLTSSSSGSSSSESMNEVYYWFNVPLGFIITKTVSKEILFGIEPRIDFMVYGAMQVNMSTGNSNYTIDYPAVTLGNKASYRLEAFFEFRRKHSAIRVCPYVQIYGFGQSDTATATFTAYGSTAGKMEFLEPQSASTWYGLNLQIDFLKNRISNE